MATKRRVQVDVDRQIVIVTTKEAIKAQTIKILQGVMEEITAKRMREWFVDAIEHDTSVQEAVREFLVREARTGRQ